ncbi:HAMP domain-containing histidine kinase [Patescibacteria group bacterium]|nr:HAMP domain-containing histidine kinase [Patescibacteria group bacterium]
MVRAVMSTLATRRRSNQKLTDLELTRLVEFGRFGASLIHEMSTPLTAASLTLAQLEDKHSDQLLREVRRDLKLLERYVIAARKQLKGESSPNSFSVTVAIHQVVMILSAKAKANNVKLLVNSLGSIRLYGDQVKFHQIMANLINNAIEAYLPYADVPRHVLIRVELADSDKVRITVSDSGIGMSRRLQKHIFESFYSGKGNMGLGLGLANVKYYVEHDFGGTIGVHSRLGSGTSFSVVLPIRTN